MLATIALAASLSAHWVNWSVPGMVVTQKAIAVGTPRVDERVILFFKDGTCSHVQTYSGRYGDQEKAWAFLRGSNLCRAHN